MRVAVVEPEGRGGLLHHALMLGRAMARAEGVEVTLVTARGAEIGDAMRDELAAAGVRVVALLRLWDPKPGPGSAGAGATAGSNGRAGWFRPILRVARGLVWYREWLRLAGYLKRLDPDIVQLGDVRFAGDLAPILALRALGLRLADVCHNVRPFSGTAGRFGGGGGLERRVYRAIYRRFDLVFVHHRVNREAFLRRYELPPERVREVPLGNGRIFLELRRPHGPTATDLRRRLGLPEGAPVVLLFGSLSRYKGVDLLVEAFARVRREHPEARLVVAGFPLPGFDLQALLDRAEGLGVGAALVLVPEYLPSEEVAAWLEMAAVAVFPYREIFQSAALQAALTCGAPTVATRVGAVPEVVRHGETGLMVRPEDPGALARAVGALLADPAQARRLGDAAARDQRERWSWERVAREMVTAYRERLGAAGGRP